MLKYALNIFDLTLVFESNFSISFWLILLTSTLLGYNLVGLISVNVISLFLLRISYICLVNLPNRNLAKINWNNLSSDCRIDSVNSITEGLRFIQDELKKQNWFVTGGNWKNHQQIIFVFHRILYQYFYNF